MHVEAAREKMKLNYPEKNCQYFNINDYIIVFDLMY